MGVPEASYLLSFPVESAWPDIATHQPPASLRPT
jgi:hypothetical protein